MTLTDAARKRLIKLLPQGCIGFEVQGYLGTCRGSTPVLKPVKQPPASAQCLSVNGLLFFFQPSLAELLHVCTLDYDPSFFGKGLNLTWEHHDGCACHQ